MKIAVQLYGHLRTFRKCAPALKKHILDHYDADVFIHTWDRTEHDDKSWYSDNVKCNAEPVNDALLAEIETLYAPKAIKVETQNFFEEVGHFGTHDEIHISLQGVKYMTYGKYAVNQLREEYAQANNVLYDYVVVLRPDIMPFVKLDFDKYRAEFEFFENTSIHLVHHSEIKFRSNRIFNYPLMTDCFYFAKPETIDKITSIYEAFDYYYKDIGKTFPKQVECPEIAFFENIIQKGICPRQYLFYFAIKRHNNEGDLKRLPPKKLGPTDQIIERKGARTTKKVLKLISDKFPSFVILKLISFFGIMGTCGRYLQALEQRK